MVFLSLWEVETQVLAVTLLVFRGMAEVHILKHIYLTDKTYKHFTITIS
jgi:hypothetical protein